jgi:hypothetical protein
LIREDGQIAQPWLVLIIDDYGPAIAGYDPGFDPPSSTSTALALRCDEPLIPEVIASPLRMAGRNFKLTDSTPHTGIESVLVFGSRRLRAVLPPTWH